MAKLGILNMTAPPYPSFISCGYRIFNPGETHDRRIFSAFVILLVTKGTVYITENEVQYQLRPNQYLILPPKILHFGHLPSKETTEYYWIHFMPYEWEIKNENTTGETEKIQLLDSGLGIRRPALRLNLPTGGAFEVTADSFYLEKLLTAYKSGDFLSAQAYFEKLLGQLLLPSPVNGIENVACKVRNYIALHKGMGLGVAKVGEALNYSPDYLSRCFKKIYGESVHDYIDRVKMEMARTLLLSSAYNLAQISAEVGFKNPTTFSRWFKKNTQTSPSEYREKFSEALSNT